MNKIKFNIVFNYILLGVLLSIGFFVALKKPLWNDEYYSHLSSIEQMTYVQMIQGKVVEGNNSPLFYALQKLVVSVSGFQTPEEWRKGVKHWDDFKYPQARLILRIVPIVSISLSILLIFCYFYKFHSLVSGTLSIFLSASSITMWVFLAEARHYGLWLFLTTAQMILFLYLFQKNINLRRTLLCLGLVHFALSLTVIFSAVQVCLTGVLLFFLKKCDIDWKWFVIFCCIPIGIAFFYYTQAQKYTWYFDFNIEQLVRFSFSRYRIYILYIYLFFLGVYFLNGRILNSRISFDGGLLKGLPCLYFTVASLFGAIAILLMFQVFLSREGGGQFPLTGKYIAFLCPVGIIATTYFSVLLIKSFKQVRWIQIVISCGVLALCSRDFIKFLPDLAELLK